MEFTPKYNATIDNMPQLPYAIEEAVNRLRVNLSFRKQSQKNHGCFHGAG